VRTLPFLKSCLILARRLGTLCVLLLAVTALLIGGTRHDLLVFRIAVTASVAILGWASWTMSQRTPPRWLRTCELALFNLALFLVLAEGSLRLLNASSATSLLLPRTLDSFRLEPGRDYGAGLRGNRLGYPGPDRPLQKPSNVCRIAALGDSFAVGPVVAFEDNYLTRLEQANPSIEVLNFGVAGTGPREYLEILQSHALAFKPDLVLLSFFIGNDVTETLATPRGLDPRQFLVYLAAERGYRLLNHPSQGAKAIDRLSGAGYSPSQFQEIEARRLEICRTPESDLLDKKWSRALSRMDAILKTCSAAGIRCAVVLIPDEFQVDDGVLESARNCAGIAEGSLDIALPQRRMREFLAARNTPCLDLLPLLKQNRGAYAPRDTHWNVLGNRLAAEAISSWLKGEKLIPGSASSSLTLRAPPLVPVSQPASVPLPPTP
jgi:SGNH hydrolase-like domain, acetyltransferase AlgX